MPQRPPSTDLPVPRWLMIVASVAICWHLGSVLVNVLAAPSGPWPTGESSGSTMTRPRFALTLYEGEPGQYEAGQSRARRAAGLLRAAQALSPKNYLWAVRLPSDYHFPSNQAGLPDLYLEVRLRDEQKQEVGVVRLPDPQANAWVWHRQKVLAGWLGQDLPVAPPNEAIAAPGQTAQTIAVWEGSEAGRMRIRNLPVHLIPRDSPVVRPSELSLVLADAFARHLCRIHGAASAEVVRYHQNPIPPRILIEDLQSEPFGKVVSNYGEFPK